VKIAAIGVNVLCNDACNGNYEEWHGKAVFYGDKIS